MPTENRSSSTEAVSINEMTECQFHNNCGGWCETRRQLEHNLCEHCLETHDEEMAGPAQATKPQPELGAPYGWHVEWADSGDRYLFTKVEKRIEALRVDSDVKVVQLYTHADPAEVERLRAEVAKFRGYCVDIDSEKRELEHKMDAYKGAAKEVVALRAQLAEAQALLEEVTGDVHFVIASDTRQRIDAHLSASADQSAPTPMPAYMEAVCDKFDWKPEEALRFYAEGKHFDTDNGRTRILCTGAIASHALKGMSKEYADLKGSEQGEPSAPVEVNKPLATVDGDLIPPVGSKVLIHLAREDEWVEHAVVGYYAWGNHGLDQNVHRVFVRVRDAEGYLNARLLSDVRSVTSARSTQSRLSCNPTPL